MVKQKEVLEKVQKKINSLRKKLAITQSEYREKFGEVAFEISQLDDEIYDLTRKNSLIQVDIAREISDNPEGYGNGDSWKLKDSVTKKATRASGIDFRDLTSVIWDAYWKAVEKAIKSNEAKKDRLRKKIEALEETDGFVDAREKVEDLNGELERTQRELTNLSDLSYFRQWAKQQKENKRDAVARGKRERSRKDAKEWVRANLFKKVA